MGLEWENMNQEIPLFPLNTVLFPGMPLNLHIFEPRYKLMIGECLKESRPFGVVLIRSGHEVGESAQVYEVGTMAQITRARPLNNGEMDITALGSRRFYIEHTVTTKPYMTGIVKDYPLEDVLNPCIGQLARQISAMVQRYLKIFATLGNIDLKMDSLPQDPATLAFLTAVILHMPMKDKQQLLDKPDLVSMLKAERRMLVREAEILKILIEQGARYRDDSQPFSPN
jgi:uncharacterized protein